MTRFPAYSIEKRDDDRFEDITKDPTPGRARGKVTNIQHEGWEALAMYMLERGAQGKAICFASYRKSQLYGKKCGYVYSARSVTRSWAKNVFRKTATQLRLI
jgi:hypothetical protein